MSIIRQHLLDLKVSLSFLVRPDKSLSYRHKEKDLHSAPPSPLYSSLQPRVHVDK